MAEGRSGAVVPLRSEAWLIYMSTSIDDYLAHPLPNCVDNDTSCRMVTSPKNALMPIARFAIPTELAPMCLHWSLVRVLHVSGPGAMQFTCRSGGESIRDASCLTEPDPATRKPQGLPRLASTTVPLNFITLSST